MREAGTKAPRHAGTKGKRLPRSFFAAGPEALAPALLGQRLVRILPDGTRLAGLIVETEAYLGVEDRAAHSFGGRRTQRVKSMYQRPGTAYVYFTYGMHYCFNVVCGAVDEPVAVLIRALEPTEGLEAMRAARAGRPGKGGMVAARRDPARVVRDGELCSGPAKLCRAMSIDRSLDGADLVKDDRFFIETGRSADLEPRMIGRARRIGVDYAGDWARRELRWFVRGNPNVSRPPR
ncbi:MAG: DNA-3-methyladenine glycosylase [Phycisphaerales bacterium]|nr:DNA-3-methyladenine glycosylase [Phycisphaerales bacterium]